MDFEKLSGTFQIQIRNKASRFCIIIRIYLNWDFSDILTVDKEKTEKAEIITFFFIIFFIIRYCISSSYCCC